MSATATSPTRIVNRVSCWSQPGHGDARPHSYPPAAFQSAIGPESHPHWCKREPEIHQRPSSPDRHALAPRLHRQNRDQIAIAPASASAPHLPRVPSLEAFGRRPCASRIVAMGRHPKPFTQPDSCSAASFDRFVGVVSRASSLLEVLEDALLLSEERVDCRRASGWKGFRFRLSRYTGVFAGQQWSKVSAYPPRHFPKSCR